MGIREQGRVTPQEKSISPVACPWRVYAENGRVFPILGLVHERHPRDLGWRQAVLARAMFAVKPDESWFVYEDVADAVPYVYADVLMGTIHNGKVDQEERKKVIQSKVQDAHRACITIADKLRKIDANPEIVEFPYMSHVVAWLRSNKYYSQLSPLEWAAVIEGDILFTELREKTGLLSLEQRVSENHQPASVEEKTDNGKSVIGKESGEQELHPKALSDPPVPAENPQPPNAPIVVFSDVGSSIVTGNSWRREVPFVPREKLKRPGKPRGPRQKPTPIGFGNRNAVLAEPFISASAQQLTQQPENKSEVVEGKYTLKKDEIFILGSALRFLFNRSYLSQEIVRKNKLIMDENLGRALARATNASELRITRNLPEIFRSIIEKLEFSHADRVHFERQNNMHGRAVAEPFLYIQDREMLRACLYEILYLYKSSREIRGN